MALKQPPYPDQEPATTDPLYAYDDAYRDVISTVDEKGKRVWVYPKKPKGRFHRWRIVVTVILLSVFFAGPFLTIKGRPFLLLNVFERKFVVFGQVFWPHDFILLALTLITFFVFIILFTVVFGRLWCGWACPQTLFMEMVFRKIEYWIEGDANEQRRLDQAPWTPGKIARKAGKHFLFVLLSLLISHTAMAYLIGVDETVAIMRSSPADHVAGFSGLMAFTAIFYLVFARFREQACVAVCPYGRLQGVLLTPSSLVVAYDWLRGEPRGKLHRKAPSADRGDCIDCKLCVHVCPTGIDIRNGTQLECVNCTACIDACDDVMVKIGKPKGLIRFASYESIKNKVSNLFTGRVVAYAAVLTALATLLGFLIFTRSEVETTVLKVPGTLYQRTADGNLTNLYHIEFLNKTFEDISLEVKIRNPEHATLTRVGNQALVIPAEKMLKGVFFISIPEAALTETRTDVELDIYQEGRLLETVRTRFIGPVK